MTPGVRFTVIEPGVVTKANLDEWETQTLSVPALLGEAQAWLDEYTDGDAFSVIEAWHLRLIAEECRIRAIEDRDCGTSSFTRFMPGKEAAFLWMERILGLNPVDLENLPRDAVYAWVRKLREKAHLL